ncbi:MAG TPA: hypothetical protein PKW55_03830 [Spirochaetota bacterium]|nr:hypothetical protein [Spirochaetota bacterium]HOM38036.1 hypothetical protein [Spirochaetota bacterium]HPQ48840.1 hypothetical protein [Spirochaetota bacterium]
MTEEQIKYLEKHDAMIHNGKIIFEELTIGDLGNIQYALAFVIDKFEKNSHKTLESFRKTLKKIDDILLQYED